LRSPDADYYSLELRLSGTDLPDSDQKVRPARRVEGLEVLKFENGKYATVSCSGDVTSVEDFIGQNCKPE